MRKQIHAGSHIDDPQIGSPDRYRYHLVGVNLTGYPQGLSTLQTICSCRVDLHIVSHHDADVECHFIYQMDQLCNGPRVSLAHTRLALLQQCFSNVEFDQQAPQCHCQLRTARTPLDSV